MSEEEKREEYVSFVTEAILVKLVGELNEDIADLGKNMEPDKACYFSMSSDGFVWMGVEWCGVTIWNNIEDERKYDESAQRWEDLRGFLIVVARRVLAKATMSLGAFEVR